MTPTVGSIVANRFELVCELGRGTMGSVWLANHLTLHVRCAVKFMSGDSQSDPSFRSRFEFEARAIAQLQSPHVVRILDYAVVADVPFIAMEYLQGEDLSARLKRVGRLDPASTYRVISQVARGLGKAHLAQLVHRDIKPENVFLAREDDEQELVKLLDFGVAKSSAFALQGTGTQAGLLIGTPAYMSPEQVRGTREIDHRSDLWSLAVIAYQCLTGRLPFESQALGDLFAQIMYEPMPVPTEIAPWLTAEFDAWWARAASRKVDDRFSSARELAVALGQALAIPGVGSSDSGETRRWLHLPTPSLPPVELTPPSATLFAKPSHLTTTRSPFTRSIRGARALMRSRRYVVATAALVAAMAIVLGIALSGSPVGSTVAAGERVASQAPAASSAYLPAPPAAPDAGSPNPQAARTADPSTVLVTDLPRAPPEWAAKPASSSERVPGSVSAPAPTPSGARPSSKRSSDVDFGI